MSATTQEPVADETLDVRGKRVPATLIEARDRLRLMESGRRLEVICDDPASLEEALPDYCEKKRYPFELHDGPDGARRMLIDKTY